MQYGLIWLALKKMQEKGFTLMVPPVLVQDIRVLRQRAFSRSGKADQYQVLNGDDWRNSEPAGA